MTFPSSFLNQKSCRLNVPGGKKEVRTIQKAVYCYNIILDCHGWWLDTSGGRTNNNQLNQSTFQTTIGTLQHQTRTQFCSYDHKKGRKTTLMRLKASFRSHVRLDLQWETNHWPRLYYNQLFWWNYLSLMTIYLWRTDPTKATKAESMLTKTQQSITQILTIQRVCI